MFKFYLGLFIANFSFIILGNKGPDFLIIGAMKCGTTSLYQYLTMHPQVAAANHKELHYFDMNFDKGLNWYFDQFPQNKENKITGEATPFYIFSPDIPKKVFQLFPKIKLIVLLRNPVERAISHYYYFDLRNRRRRHDNKEIKLEFDQIFEIEKKRMDDLDAFFQAFTFGEIQFYCTGLGIYINQIKRWREYFPECQMLIIDSDNLLNDTANTVNKVFEFLGLPNYNLASYETYNKNYRKKEIKKETIDQLYDFYEKYNQELEDYLGIKFNWNEKRNSVNQNFN